MTGRLIKVDASDLRDMDRRAQAMLAELSDTTPLMDEIGSYVSDVTRHRFETNVGPDGKDWTPSARALAQGGRTLVDRGHLRDSITYHASATEAVIGTNSIYAGIHQDGGKTGRGHKTEMPARPFLGLSGEDETEIHNIALDFLRGAIQ